MWKSTFDIRSQVGEISIRHNDCSLTLFQERNHSKSELLHNSGMTIASFMKGVSWKDSKPSWEERSIWLCDSYTYWRKHNAGAAGWSYWFNQWLQLLQAWCDQCWDGPAYSSRVLKALGMSCVFTVDLPRSLLVYRFAMRISISNALVCGSVQLMFRTRLERSKRISDA